MLTPVQFEARENEVFAALRVLSRHKTEITDVGLEDNDSFAVLSTGKNATASFALVDDSASPARAQLYSVFAATAQRVSTNETLCIKYKASSLAAFPFIQAKGGDDWRSRVMIAEPRQRRLGEQLHKYSRWPPDYINYATHLMVFNNPQNFDAALELLLEHIDENDLSSHVTLIGRRQSSVTPEQLWPK